MGHLQQTKLNMAIAKSTKIKFFRACDENILLYGAETWTISKELEKRLDGTYTRLLMQT